MRSLFLDELPNRTLIREAGWVFLKALQCEVKESRLLVECVSGDL